MLDYFYASFNLFTQACEELEYDISFLFERGMFWMNDDGEVLCSSMYPR